MIFRTIEHAADGEIELIPLSARHTPGVLRDLSPRLHRHHWVFHQDGRRRIVRCIHCEWSMHWNPPRWCVRRK